MYLIKTKLIDPRMESNPRSDWKTKRNIPAFSSSLS